MQILCCVLLIKNTLEQLLGKPAIELGSEMSQVVSSNPETATIKQEVGCESYEWGKGLMHYYRITCEVLDVLMLIVQDVT